MFNFFKNKNIFKKEGKVLKILSGYNSRYRSIGKKSQLNIIKYAKHYNFDYEFEITNNFERPFFWLKIKMLIDNLKKNDYEYFFWLDADIFFCRYENILDIIDKKKNLFIVNQFFQSKNKSPYKNSKLLTWGPNTGVMLVRNCKWSLNFLEEIWNNKKYINHSWGDNASFLDIIGYKSELTNIHQNKPKKIYLNKIQYLPGQWNSMPKLNFNNDDFHQLSTFYFDPIIIHLAGMRRKNRVKFIKKYNNLFI